IAYCRARKDPVPHFAARFAAKEAGLKALGTGLRLGISWRELEVKRERGGPPMLILRGRSREIARQRGGDRMLLALTHDGDYAIAAEARAFYAEIHASSRRESASRIEITTAGVDASLAARLRTLYELIRDAHLRGYPGAPRVDVRVEPFDVRVDSAGVGAPTR